MFHGVTAGGAPWVLKLGDVRLERVGKLDPRVKGLVIPTLGTPGPVTTISATQITHSPRRGLLADRDATRGHPDARVPARQRRGQRPQQMTDAPDRFAAASPGQSGTASPLCRS